MKYPGHAVIKNAMLEIYDMEGLPSAYSVQRDYIAIVRMDEDLLVLIATLCHEMPCRALI